MPLCYGCMQEIGNESVCPVCGFDNTEKQTAPYLPYGTELAGRYIVGAGIDTNGESTRYLGFDEQTGDLVIVCEFLPVGLFIREEDEAVVQVNEDRVDDYIKLKNDFLNYYRVLSELRELSALTNIHNIFEENNTAYVVEEYEDLIPFEEYVERSNGSLEWDIARPLFMPVISALEAMHKRGLGHYAISPKNMYITTQGKIRISGFATENERKRGTLLKSQLFSGAAAPEQYEDNFQLDDITDIYGFCATLFYALTGRQPKSAPERLQDSRLLMSTNTVKRLPPHVVSALANGLQVERENRISDFDDLRSQLSVAHTAKAIQDEISRTASMNLSEATDKHQEKNGMSHVTVSVIAAAITVLVLGIAGAVWLMHNPFAGMFGNGEKNEQSATEVTEWTGATIPNFVGKTYEEAVQAAKSDSSIHILRNYTDAFSDEVKEGSVMAQNPPAGTRVTPQDAETGVNISLTVSRGKQMRELPDVEGQALDKASEMIAAQGLLGTAEYAYNNKYAEGIVIGYRDKAKGVTVEYGTNVTLIVSKGKEPSSTSPPSSSDNDYDDDDYYD